MFIQIENGRTVSVCRFLPDPAIGDWIAVADDDPRADVPEPPAVDPVQKLRDFLAANPDVAAIL